ncbi:hypothetical protein RUM44_011293 [Polyplax serrata]|uniref:Uncharacterized protein n=1 Tax=Polyplax serrata TaxID=468196 RepID=A0ABR1APY2_POLSC
MKKAGDFDGSRSEFLAVRQNHVANGRNSTLRSDSKVSFSRKLRRAFDIPASTPLYDAFNSFYSACHLAHESRRVQQNSVLDVWDRVVLRTKAERKKVTPVQYV